MILLPVQPLEAQRSTCCTKWLISAKLMMPMPHTASDMLTSSHCFRQCSVWAQGHATPCALLHLLLRAGDTSSSLQEPVSLRPSVLPARRRPVQLPAGTRGLAAIRPIRPWLTCMSVSCSILTSTASSPTASNTWRFRMSGFPEATPLAMARRSASGRLSQM